jgi:soluble lytic murein transglycosylase
MRGVTLALPLALLVGLAASHAGAEPAAPPADPASPTRGLDQERRDRFVAALAAYRSGSWSAAAGEFGDPRWAGTPLREYALLFHAESAQRLGDTAGARRATEAAVRGHLAPAALVQAAFLLAGAGDDAGAATLFRRFLDRHAEHPAAPRARLGLAQSLLAAGRTGEAARALSEVWIQAPASLYAEVAARQLSVLGSQGLAGPSPTQAERVERAERLLATGLPESARAEVDALLDQGLPSDLLARGLRVVLEASRRAGRYDAATAAVNRALASLPPERRAPWLLELARLQQRRSRDLALATLDRLVRDHRKSPEAAGALFLKAQLLEAASHPGEASAAYLRLPVEYPDTEEAGAALWRLGWLAWSRGAHAEAAAHWGRVPQIRGGHGHREAATYWLGRVHDERGESEMAARHFAQLQGEAPRTYYGLLAARRRPAAGVPRASSAGIALPADPLEPLAADPRYVTVAALRAVGLEEFADDEMENLTRQATGDPKRLYAISAAYARESRYHLALRILRRQFHSVARRGLASAPASFWELLYPIGWRAELADAAQRAAVDPYLVAAVVREESSFHPQARSRVGARGLMQLMPETARPMARARGLPFNNGDLLDDPGANLEMGTAFLARLLREFGDPRLATAAYNAGPGRVREWWGARRSDDLEVFVEQIPFSETRAFVKRVMVSWAEYRRVYAGQLEVPRGAAGER